MPALIAQRSRSQATVWNSALTANTAEPLEVLGATRPESEGRIFVYVRSEDALAIGDCVRLDQTNTPADNSVQADGAAALGVTAITFNTVGSELPAAAANSYRGWYLTVNMDNVARQGDTYRIVSNTATVINIDRGLDTALVTADLLTLWNPWRVKQTTATTDPLYGVAMGTVTAGNYGWVQTQGLHTQVKVRTTATNPSWGVNAAAGAAGTLTVFAPSATAGALEAVVVTSAAATTAELNRAIRARAFPVFASAGTTAATRNMPFILGTHRPGD